MRSRDRALKISTATRTSFQDYFSNSSRKFYQRAGEIKAEEIDLEKPSK